MAWRQKEYPRCAICNCPITEKPHSTARGSICNECYIKHYDEYQSDSSSDTPRISSAGKCNIIVGIVLVILQFIGFNPPKPDPTIIYFIGQLMGYFFIGTVGILFIISGICLKESGKNKEIPVKTVTTNILGAVVGALIWFFSFFLLFILMLQLPAISFILQLGIDPAYVVFPFSSVISSGISLLACYFICQPTRTNRKLGCCGLGIYTAIQYLMIATLLFYYNGFHFAFLVFALFALGASALVFLCGLHKQKPKKKAACDNNG